LFRVIDYDDLISTLNLSTFLSFGSHNFHRISKRRRRREWCKILSLIGAAVIPLTRAVCRG